jgi:hypothetical protein
MKKFINEIDEKIGVIPLITLIILTAVIFIPIHLTQIAYHDITDYPSYRVFIQEVINDPKYWSDFGSHPGWLLIVIAVKWIFSLPIWKAIFTVQVGFQEFLALILYFLARDVFPREKKWAPIFLSLGLMLVTPIFLFAFKDKLLYFGYIGINTTHNPTIIGLKPFALLAFFFVISFFNNIKLTPPVSFLATLVIVYSSLIKPNYLICLLPAIGIMFIVKIVNKEVFPWKRIIGFIIIPSVLVLAFQALITYSGPDSQIIFFPFGVMKNSSNYLFPKFILSIWFPILILIAYFKEAFQSTELKLAWLSFMFGAIYSYFFAEGGPRIYHGNFLWSGEITLFILFVISTLFFFKQILKTPNLKKWKSIFWIGFMPHIVAGVIYFGYCLLNNRYF